MSDPTNQELKDLILGLEKKFEAQLLQVDNKIMQLDKKMDVQFAELKGEILRVEEKIQHVEDKLIVEIKRGDEKLSGEIKLVDERLNGMEKRIGNEEFISRSAFTVLFASAMAGLTKYLFFSSASGL
jgi:septal ring factor EnvC (AmiA/AmiB activator)